jgi:hypothetical protein
MKPQPATLTQPSNQHLWQTFKMEETMKQQPASAQLARKPWLVFIVAMVLLFSACSQQPTPQAEDLEPQLAPIVPVPAWKQLGGALDVNPALNSRSSSLGVSTTGSLYAAWSEDSSGINLQKVVVKRWASAPFNSWFQVGTALNVESSKVALKPSLAMGTDNKPVVAFHECNSISFPAICNVYVKRWSGAAWVLLSSKLNVNSGYYASLAIDSLNRPVVAWFERALGGYNIYVKRWTGAGWASLGGAVNVDSSKLASMPSLAVGTGNPVVAWQECAVSVSVSGNPSPFTCQHRILVRSYDAATNTWKASLGASGAINVNSSRDAKLPSLKLTSGGTPIVAFVECVQVGVACHENSDHNVYVKRYGTKKVGSFFVFGFHLMGNALDVNIAQATKWPSLAIDPNDNPMVAWAEGGSTSAGFGGIRVKRWVSTTSTWQTVSSPNPLNISPNQHDDEPSLVISSTETPSVAFQEAQDAVGVLANIYVRRLQ